MNTYGWLPLVFVLLEVSVVLEAGRPVQEDPRFPKGKDNKRLVIDAPEEELSPNINPTTHKPTTTLKPSGGVKSAKFPTKKLTKADHIFGGGGSPSEKKHLVEEVKERAPIFDNSQDDDDLDPSARAKRQDKKFGVFEKFGHLRSIKLDWYHKPLVESPLFQYGDCLLGLGYSNNPQCRFGEVCVDKVNGLKVTNCNAPCKCPPAPPPPPCPPPCPVTPKPLPPGQQSCGKGCKPEKGCPYPNPDGICLDSTFPTDTYVDLISTEKINTPMVYYSGTLNLNDTCTAYGDAIDDYLRGPAEFGEKIKTVRTNAGVTEFGTEICNWAVSRLECIPDVPRGTVTTTPPPIGSQPDPNANRRPKGTCQCMLALGEKAVVVYNQEGIGTCYIPAHRGHHSDCDHDIFLPYGGIDATRKDGRMIMRSVFESASKFCVPNGECRPGYKYTGVRCQCKKKTKWDPRTSTCNGAGRLVPPLKLVDIVALPLGILLQYV